MARDFQATWGVNDLRGSVEVQVFERGSARVIAVVRPISKARIDTAVDAAVDAALSVIAALTVASIPGLQAALASKATPADITAAIARLMAGSPTELDTFIEVYNRFLSNEGALANLVGVAAQKVAQTAFDADLADHTNPHAVTKAQVGLGNVAKLAPADLTVSTAQAQAIDALRVALLNGADAAHDTLGEIQAILLADEGTLAALLTAVGQRLVAASNLSDVTDKAAALANLNGLDRRILALAVNHGASDILAGTIRVAKNTTSGRLSLWANDGGTLVDMLAPAQF